jgi:hypothetical protein
MPDVILGRVVNEVLRNPITGRDIRESRQMYQSVLNNSDKVYCVWTGRLLSRYDIDHGYFDYTAPHLVDIDP